MTIKTRPSFLTIGDREKGRLQSGDVMVVSGGGRGITPRLIRALAPLRPRLALLGRSDLQQTQETAQTLRDLSRRGLEAEYYRCNVTDADAVMETLERIVARYGRIDGIVHGAGELKDSFLEFMSAEDFARVMNVKLSGGWNLYRAARGSGLKSFTALSSVSAIQGNAGQVNYCAANRALAALVRSIDRSDREVTAKALFLPPIEGKGMADSPELKELFRLRGMEASYLHVDEMAELFARELVMAPNGEPWVMPVRFLPRAKTTLINKELDQDAPDRPLVSAGVSFSESDLPMIDTVERLDLAAGELDAGRTFCLRHDLWLGDHQPFHFLPHPVVSAIMAVETFLEAARALCPHLFALSVSDIELRDLLECADRREARIHCRRKTEGSELSCLVSIASRDLSPSGAPLDHWSTNFSGRVKLGGRQQLTADPRSAIEAIEDDELDSPPLGRAGVVEMYRRWKGIGPLYRILETLHGTGPDVIRGTSVYGPRKDFANVDEPFYQFPPYILEALLQVGIFHEDLRGEGRGVTVVPLAIDELRLSPVCPPEGRLTIEARRRSAEGGDRIWDARATGTDGAVALEAFGLRFREVEE